MLMANTSVSSTQRVDRNNNNKSSTQCAGEMYAREKDVVVKMRYTVQKVSAQHIQYMQ